MSMTEQTRPLADFVREQRREPTLHRRGRPAFADYTNVGDWERVISLATGSLLTLVGLKRRNLAGLLMAGTGGAMLYRGATGHCHVYEALDIDTADDSAKQRDQAGLHVVHSVTINKSPEELYRYWRDLEKLPDIMSHLESVRETGPGRSHWTAAAPSIVGGSVEWDAEITEDKPNERIAWQSLPGGDVDCRGAVEFRPMPGKRGTAVRVELEYLPPAGRLGHWIAKLFGEAADQQIRDDLRRFKRVLETGEVLTVEGQSSGACIGVRWRND